MIQPQQGWQNPQQQQAHNPMAQQWNQQPQQQQQGPAHAALNSTAPDRGAERLVEGLPPPWPLPNSTQQNLHHNPATASRNQALNAVDTAGPSWTPSADEVGIMKGGMEMLMGMYEGTGPVKRVLDDTKKRFQEMYNTFESGQMAESTGKKVVEMASKVQQGDLISAKGMQAQLSQTSTDARNKQWLVGVHRAFTAVVK